MTMMMTMAIMMVMMMMMMVMVMMMMMTMVMMMMMMIMMTVVGAEQWLRYVVKFYGGRVNDDYKALTPNLPQHAYS